MIALNADVQIERVPLRFIQVVEYQVRYPERLTHYLNLLLAYPHDYAGLVVVAPSNTHQGMFRLLDGHHRFVASIMAGRTDILAVINYSDGGLL